MGLKKIKKSFCVINLTSKQRKLSPTADTIKKGECGCVKINFEKLTSIRNIFAAILSG